jgi:hypothetical protein
MINIVKATSTSIPKASGTKVGFLAVINCVSNAVKDISSILRINVSNYPLTALKPKKTVVVPNVQRDTSSTLRTNAFVYQLKTKITV